MAVVIQTAGELIRSRCVPCEGGVPKLTNTQAKKQLKQISGWSLTKDNLRIRKTWVVQNFIAAMNFFNHVTCIAECEGHHPDLHLEGYRNVTIEIYTHAIGGLSVNDFILAAKIDILPVSLKR